MTNNYDVTAVNVHGTIQRCEAHGGLASCAAWDVIKELSKRNNDDTTVWVRVINCTDPKDKRSSYWEGGWNHRIGTYDSREVYLPDFRHAMRTYGGVEV